MRGLKYESSSTGQIFEVVCKNEYRMKLRDMATSKTFEIPLSFFYAHYKPHVEGNGEKKTQTFEKLIFKVNANGELKTLEFSVKKVQEILLTDWGSKNLTKGLIHSIKVEEALAI